MINVGVIGMGYMGPVHLEALSRIEDVRVRAVADINYTHAQKTAQRYNIKKSYQDYKEILKDPEIDVIHNCTPNRFHYIINMEALKNGKQILSEKPLAINVREAEELTDLAEKKGITTGIDFCYRYYPLVQDTAVRIRKGQAGNIRMITGSYLQDWLFFPTDYTWRLESKESGESNITADLGSHWIDLIQFVSGLKVTRVFGDFSTLIPVRKKPSSQVLAFQKAVSSEVVDSDVELEEYSSVLFRLSNGSPGSFTTCQLCAGKKSAIEFQIYGSECSLCWNHDRSNELWIGHREKPNETLIESPTLQDPLSAKYATLPAGHPLGYHDAVLGLFKEFYSAVKNGKGEGSKMQRPSFYTGYKEMQILESIIRSNNKGEWVEVDY